MFGQPIHIRLASVIIGCRLIGQPHFMSTPSDLISALMKVGREEGIQHHLQSCSPFLLISTSVKSV